MRAIVLGVVMGIVTVAGCGRFGFNELARNDHDGDGGGGGSQDAAGAGGDGGVRDAGALPLACTPAGPEICNGIDDNCDGVVDEGCPCTALAKPVAENPALYASAFAWTGHGFLQVGGNAATIGLQPIDDTGAPGTSVVLFSGAAGSTSGTAEVAWTGSSLGVAFDHDQGQVEVAVYNPASTGAVNANVSKNYPGYDEQIAWAAGHFVVAWVTAAGQLVTREVGSDGALLAAEQVVTTGVAGSIDAYQVTSSGAVACIRVSADSTTELISVTAAGVATTHTLPIGAGTRCQLLPIPGGFLAWNAAPSSPTATSAAPLALLGADGTLQHMFTLPALASDSYRDVSIARIPDGFWVVAMTSNSSNPYAYSIEGLNLDDAGNVTSGPTPLTAFSASLFSAPLAIATGGREAWEYSSSLTAGSFTLTQSCP